MNKFKTLRDTVLKDIASSALERFEQRPPKGSVTHSKKFFRYRNESAEFLDEASQILDSMNDDIPIHINAYFLNDAIPLTSNFERNLSFIHTCMILDQAMFNYCKDIYEPFERDFKIPKVRRRLGFSLPHMFRQEFRVCYEQHFEPYVKPVEQEPFNMTAQSSIIFSDFIEWFSDKQRLLNLHKSLVADPHVREYFQTYFFDMITKKTAYLK